MYFKFHSDELQPLLAISFSIQALEIKKEKRDRGGGYDYDAD